MDFEKFDIKKYYQSKLIEQFNENLLSPSIKKSNDIKFSNNLFLYCLIF